MTTLHLVLADAELELVPRQIARHPQVRADARRAEKPAAARLLDSSLHHAAMRELEDGDRRGRPDLVHLFLLTTLDSRLNAAGRLAVHVHTRNDEHLRIDPDTRIMRNFPRFVGLMEQLFDRGRIPPKGDPLMVLEPDWTLADVVASTGADHVVATDPSGDAAAPGAMVGELVSTHADPCIVLGGFPKGGYRSELEGLADRSVAFGDEQLSVWTVAAEVVVHAADRLLDRVSP